MAAAAAFGGRRQRIFRDRKDFFAIYTDEELLKRFRLDRGGILFVTDLVRDAVSPSTCRNKAISAEFKIVCTLRYLATGKMQLCNGDDFGLSQPSISKVITETLNALTTPVIIRRFITFPLNHHEVRMNEAAFLQIAGFPGVVGVIDGTHVRIQAPHKDEPEFVNRKHFHSLNVQVIFDAEYKLMEVVAKWPGSTHDARILHESGIKQMFDRRLFPGGCHLLGDSGYPCKTWLLTPFLRPQPGDQSRYNRYHNYIPFTTM
ncbi:putative nuclease HARBI1 [Gigantopelta aegis]|uniref:putative nuclease HARBI1 n=1 Tax=Gigantopelta aegis TaxID=1735272 RepID=UPI001B88944F|nr:putative nuclease HARBI1 [Gigantopelta aegis]